MIIYSYLFLYLYIYLFIYMNIYSFIYLFIYLFVYVFIYSYIYLFILCGNPRGLPRCRYKRERGNFTKPIKKGGKPREAWMEGMEK